MLRISHGALLHFSMDLIGGPKTAQELLHKIAPTISIQSVSSIYKRFNSDDRADLNASMEFVVKVITQLGPEEILKFLEDTKIKMNFILLVYDDVIKMSPQLTLPYPELHTDPLIIRCAAEAWGQYDHPIYMKTLSEISNLARPTRDAEFFLQGRSLIDI